MNTYIEDCIAQKDPLIKILRLVCMQSVCNNGLKQKVFDYYKREILQVESKTLTFVFGAVVFSVPVLYIPAISTKANTCSGEFLCTVDFISRITQLLFPFF